VPFDQLFVMHVCDLWFPCFTPPGRIVTIHVGTRVYPATKHRANGETSAYEQEVVYELDHRAACQISEHLYRKGNARVLIEGHSPEGSAAGDRTLDAMVKEIFAKEVQIFVGSPIASALSEKLVARLFARKPFTPSERDGFPYCFNYPSATTSSFGSHEPRRELGIYSTKTGRLVARRDRIPRCGQAEGQVLEDCGLIVVARLRVAPRNRQFAQDSRILIGFLGNGGLGTYGAAIAAFHPHHAAQLFPKEIGTVRAAVVRVPYERSLGSPRILAPELVEITDFHDGELREIPVTPPPTDAPSGDEAPPTNGTPPSNDVPTARRRAKRKAAAHATSGGLRDALGSGLAIQSGARARKRKRRT